MSTALVSNHERFTIGTTTLARSASCWCSSGGPTRRRARASPRMGRGYTDRASLIARVTPSRRSAVRTRRSGGDDRNSGHGANPLDRHPPDELWNGADYSRPRDLPHDSYGSIASSWLCADDFRSTPISRQFQSRSAIRICATIGSRSPWLCTALSLRRIAQLQASTALHLRHGAPGYVVKGCLVDTGSPALVIAFAQQKNALT